MVKKAAAKSTRRGQSRTVKSRAAGDSKSDTKAGRPAYQPGPLEPMQILDERLLLPQSVCAIALNISVQALKRWRVKPREKRGREVLYYLPELLRYQVGRDESGKLSLTDERARVARAQAERMELELEEYRRTLIPADEVVEAWEKIAAAVRTKVLGFPSKVKRTVPSMNTRQFEKVRKIARDALDELAGGGVPKKRNKRGR